MNGLSNLPPGVTDRMIDDAFADPELCSECGEEYWPPDECDNCGFMPYEPDEPDDWEGDLDRGIAPDAATQDLWDHGYDSRYA